MPKMDWLKRIATILLEQFFGIFMVSFLNKEKGVFEMLHKRRRGGGDTFLADHYLRRPCRMTLHFIETLCI